MREPALGLCVAPLIVRHDAERRAAQIDAVVALGARQVRQDLRWAYAERAPGVWDWSTEDALVDAIEGAGLVHTAMLGYGNPWASSASAPDEFFPPDDPAAFAAFAGAAAERYRGRVSRFELWNEPNAGYRFWKTEPLQLGGDAADYARLARLSAEAIRSAQPEAEIAFGSVFYHGQGIPSGPDFVRDALLAEPALTELAPIVSFHPYTLYPPRVAPEVSGEGEQSVLEMTAAMSEASGGMPLWVTEAAWPSFGDVSQTDQADWFLRQFALLQSAGVRDVCWYTLLDRENALENPEGAFGLYEPDLLTRKPVGERFAELAARLADVADARGEIARELAWPEGAYAVRYLRGDGRPLTLAWSAAGEVEVVLPHAEGLGRCAEIDEEPAAIEREGVRLRLSARPIWVAQGCEGEDP